jgi:hypothetical protein
MWDVETVLMIVLCVLLGHEQPGARGSVVSDRTEDIGLRLVYAFHPPLQS